MKRMRCTIVIPRADRRARRDIAGKIEVGLVSMDSMGVEVATWYLLSQGIEFDTILRVMTMPHRRRR